MKRSGFDLIAPLGPPVPIVTGEHLEARSRRASLDESLGADVLGVGALLALILGIFTSAAYQVGVAYAAPASVCGIVMTQFYDAGREKNVYAQKFLRRDLAVHGCK